MASARRRQDEYAANNGFIPTVPLSEGGWPIYKKEVLGGREEIIIVKLTGRRYKVVKRIIKTTKED